MSIQNTQNEENPFDIYDFDSGRKLLHEYSGIPDEDVKSHIELIRPYPCIRRYRFLELIMTTTDVYQEVLDRVKNGEKFIDLSCCFSQEIRKLVHDGAPSVNTYGSDLWGEFLSIGYDLFRDKDRLQTTFIAADIFDDSSPLIKLSRQMNIIYVGDFFHLFNLEEQEKAANRVAQLLVPQPGSLIIGRQSGSETAGEYSRAGDTSGKRHFQHNPQSWKELWERIGEKTGCTWLMAVDLHPEFKFKSAVPENKSSEIQRLMSTKGLRFTIKRL
ncbi:hypothetical protein ACHAQJ_002376 [Trichoderma viride]